MSTGFTPAACTRTRTASGPTGGSGRSSRRVRTSGPPNRSYATPRMAPNVRRTADRRLGRHRVPRCRRECRAVPRHFPRQGGRGSAAALHEATERLLDLAARIALGHVVPLVVGVLALRQRQRGLDLAVLEVQVERDEREPTLLGLADQLVDLAAVHEHLALAARRVVGPGALHVLGDVPVLQPDLAVVDAGEPVDERRATGTKALHLGAGEHEAHLVRVEDRVVVPRLLVLGDQLSPGLTRHDPIIRRPPDDTAARCRPPAARSPSRASSRRPPAPAPRPASQGAAAPRGVRTTAGSRRTRCRPGPRRRW